MKMDLETFVNSCKNSASRAAKNHQSLDKKSTELADIFQEILKNKQLDDEHSENMKSITELREFMEKQEVEKIRLNQQIKKETSRKEHLEQILQKKVDNAQKGPSESDVQTMYKKNLKSYILRRITGITLDLDETKGDNIVGWLTNMRTSTFEPFAFKKGEKSEEEISELLWERIGNQDPSSHDMWMQPGLFGDD